MRRHLLTLTLAGLFGAFLSSGQAQAGCHKKKNACPAPVAYAAPCPPPAPVAVCEPAPKKCGHKAKAPKAKRGGLCHKKQAVECAPVAYEAPVQYAAPYATPQASPQATGQASGQGL